MGKKNTEEEAVEIETKAYVYLVKVPVSNDQMVYAFNEVCLPGTYVVIPTRFGLDMGVVVGSAADMDSSYYEPGCAQVRGACHKKPSCVIHSIDSEESCFDSEDSLSASGYPMDGSIVMEDDSGTETLGPLPEFRFETTSEIPSPLEYNLQEKEIWDSAYKNPELVIVDGDIMWIDHTATSEEIARYQLNNEAEAEAVSICKDKILGHGLDMKLVAAHFLLCEQKALFFFTSDNRVDFRALVKDLVSVFRMRIELRQIGVRDESRVLGGLAVCGRDFCCHCVSDKMNPVTIRMAKEQNLALNSMKISGPCGRLLCCLSYEYNFYNEEKQAYPPDGARIKINGDLFKVIEVNILTRKITAVGSEGNIVTIPRSAVTYSSEDGRWESTQDFESFDS